MAAAFGVRLLGTALVVICGFYSLPGLKTQCAGRVICRSRGSIVRICALTPARSGSECQGPQPRRHHLYSGFQLRVQERGAFGVRRGLIPLANWYGTGSGSDLVLCRQRLPIPPGRYRSLYRTVLRNSPAVSGLAALQTLRAPEHATGNRCKRRGGSNEAPCEMFTRARGAGDQARVNNSRHIFTQQNFYPVAYAGQYSTWRSL